MECRLDVLVTFLTTLTCVSGWYDNRVTGNQRGLSPVQIQTILDAHNRYRSYVYPSAANMKKMEWDHLLQQMAQAWADGCRFQKGVVSTIQHPYNHASLGQNMGMVLQNFKPVEQLVSDWHKEGRYYIYETGECMQRRPFTCDEYTQMVWADTTKLGCGWTQCSDMGGIPADFLVCYYSPGGNYQLHGRTLPPYTRGTPCSACASDEKCEGGSLCVKAPPVAELAVRRPYDMLNTNGHQGRFATNGIVRNGMMNDPYYTTARKRKALRRIPKRQNVIRPFRCWDGRLTIPHHYICDGDQDCEDGSDEVDCTRSWCKGYYCPRKTGRVNCVHSKKECRAVRRTWRQWQKEQRSIRMSSLHAPTHSPPTEQQGSEECTEDMIERLKIFSVE
ncbi:uncharacterized protein LOC144919664 [Branchiostoma floridae x Branchiostoma belcheri]